MGNWRRVQIIGTMNHLDAQIVRQYLSGNNEDCLHGGSICGLPNWGQTTVDCVGNLWERDYTVDDIRSELVKIKVFAPSLDLTVHIGGDYEDDKCIASITTKDGVKVCQPQVDLVKKIPKSQVDRNLRKAMFS